MSEEGFKRHFNEAGFAGQLVWRCHPFYKILVWAQQENRKDFKIKMGGSRGAKRKRKDV